MWYLDRNNCSVPPFNPFLCAAVNDVLVPDSHSARDKAVCERSVWSGGRSASDRATTTLLHLIRKQFSRGQRQIAPEGRGVEGEIDHWLTGDGRPRLDNDGSTSIQIASSLTRCRSLCYTVQQRRASDEFDGSNGEWKTTTGTTRFNFPADDRGQLLLRTETGPFRRRSREFSIELNRVGLTDQRHLFIYVNRRRSIDRIDRSFLLPVCLSEAVPSTSISYTGFNVAA